ncbi:delta-aminolevulinic acid dehydratase [Campylobacter sputorum subsp. bubulus]|uniref:Delta-aminolevulinic acid dehydratase n=1 Tax=Campylobacter sputorum subsp. sputorum TaxID=32024 RepID=A0A381DI92_9BACT|nr:porphobilinogen synthase [Campylobacter sputorum]ASM35465.1 porphobilinogen synthase [Campylobacter sputorum aubsp. sputorum RM3237]KAB0582796.1 porphobilinogen synthase [Campylobacter sputorum subsp. sputorum]QEL05657.1 porphobilinogen synthase [Campylobacter sputorum subsp. sputorum]SUX08423.1 delta-aminolevulinic acid dehydratase [Campylobacter sputorum subsp. bubulus]SUX10424.1 delta-aminolevulinic acid dehydratase [Campylobacter sputorum subsp. sputorum]
MFKRFRRLRLTAQMRDLVRQTYLSGSDFIYPLFVVEGKNIKNEISSMPGVYQMSLDEILKECSVVVNLGIKAIMLFGIPSLKDSIGSDALSNDGIIAKSLRSIKDKFPNLIVITDLCFCEYTDHGHCGIMDHVHGTVDNDATLDISAKQALIHAENGADMIAPSGMMDGIIETLRFALDDGGYENLPIMAYSTKFASAYYGPFRDVAESTPKAGDRKSYQMDPANRLEAINESLEDEAQGADILMIKPALAYLDLIRDLRDRTLLPICAYNVSGEYALLKAGAKLGVIDYDKVMMETLLGMKRAGADMIITYHAKEACEILQKA